MAGGGEVDEEVASALLEGVEDLLLQVLAVADDQLSVDRHHHHAALVRRHREGHVSSACRTAIAAVSTISSAVAPRDRSSTGRARPCRMGPIASQPSSRCTSLYPMLPALRSGKTSPLARPPTRHPRP